MSEDRLRIIQHSRQKFYREGFYKISMDELSRDLRISKKTIYKHFPSKEILIEEICSQTSCDIEKNINAIIDGKDNVVVKFVKLMLMYSNFIMNVSEKWLQDLKIHTPHIACQVNEVRTQKINNIFTKLLDQGKKEKLIENYPAPIIIAAFTSTLLFVVNPDFVIKNKFSLQDAFWKSYELLLNGILTSKGKKIFAQTKSKLYKKIKNELIYQI